MLFSVVVPVYNVEKYLHECVDSIIDQIVQDNIAGEILLVDDGSKDESGRICDAYQEQYPAFVRVFHKPNEGLLLTRRYGFRQAQGEYIINCDSDDKLEPHALRAIRDAIEQTQADVVIYNAYCYDGVNKKPFFENILSAEPLTVVEKQTVYKELISSYKIVSMCLKAMKRACLDVDFDYGVYGRVQNGEDSLQSVAVYENAEKVAYLNQKLYNYRVGSGMTNKFDDGYFSSFQVVLDLIENRKDVWNVADFDRCFAKKILGIAGRAITQLRYATGYSYKDKVAYLKRLKNERFIEQYYAQFPFVKQNLQKDYRLLIPCLMKGYYGVLIGALTLKNMLK